MALVVDLEDHQLTVSSCDSNIFDEIHRFLVAQSNHFNDLKVFVKKLIVRFGDHLFSKFNEIIE